MPGEGTTVVIHYVGRIAEGEDAGEVFDTTDVDVALEEGVYHDDRDYMPLEFEVGDGSVVGGLDRAVSEMAVGETRTVTVEPDAAFGEYDDALVVEVPRDGLEDRSDAEAEVGDLVQDETGQVGWITAVDEETVEVDFNHELAGEPLAFEVRLLETR